MSRLSFYAGVLTVLSMGFLCTQAGAQTFVRGDVDGSLVVDAQDATALLLFLEVGTPLVVPEAGDVNDNGAVEISDLSFLASVLEGSVFPPAPYPFPGRDSTPNLFDPPSIPGVIYAIPSADVLAGDTGVAVPVLLSGDQPLEAVEVALSFDARKVTVDQWDLGGSLLTILGAEYLASGFSNELAKEEAWLSAVMDAEAPFDGDTLPAGVDQPLGVLGVSISDALIRATSTKILFRATESAPPARRNLVVTLGGVARSPLTFDATLQIGIPFVRGDSNGDRLLDISDIIHNLAYVFSGGPPAECLDSGDSNDDGIIDIADAVYLLTFLFSNGQAPDSPYPAIGVDPTLDALPCEGPIPQVEVWYGPLQRVGHLGMVQPQVNVLGRLRDSNPSTTLGYSLNGATESALTLGPDGRRLVHPGDFVVEIDPSELLVGANEVALLVDGVVEEVVTLDYSTGATWPLPYSVDWNLVNRIDDVAQVVDGLWEVRGGSVRVIEPGYDRLVGLGDLTWTDFEITARVEVESVEPVYTGPSAPGPIVGFLVRWGGHQPTGTQPNWGFDPLGALGGFQWRDAGVERFEIRDGTGVIAVDGAGIPLALQTPYYFKMRVETLPAMSGARFFFKAWPVGQPEPPVWLLDVTGSSVNLAAGSVLLVAHHATVEFSEIEVDF